MSTMIELLQQQFVHDALRTALMVAAVCSFLGVFVVLKRIVFVGAALSEVATLGAALSLSPAAIAGFDALVGILPALAPLQHYKPLIFALAMMLLTVMFFSQQFFGRRIPREAVIGTAFAGAAGLAALILSKVPSHDQHALDMLVGNILGVEELEMRELAVTAGIVALLQGLFFKEFVLVSFDPEVARTLGFRAARWELLWYLSLGVMIAVSVHVAGTILVLGYLVLPPVTALLLSRRLRLVFFLSVVLGVTSTMAGVLLSVSPLDLPMSPTIVAVMVALFVLAWIGSRLASLRSAK